MHYTPSVDLAFVSVEHITTINADLAIVPTILSRLKNGAFTNPSALPDKS